MRGLLKWVFSGLSLMFLGASTLMASGAPSPTSSQGAKVKMQVQSLKTVKGISYWLVQNQDAPVISIAIAFKGAGTKADRPGKFGTCWMMTSLLTEGAGEKDATEFEEFLNDKNIQLHLSKSKDYTLLDIRVPSDHVSSAIEALKMIFSKPRFDSFAVERITQMVTVALKQALFNEAARARDLMAQKALDQGHPYARTVEQTLNCIPKITVEDMKEFMQRSYCQDNIVVAICGNITQQKAALLLDDFVSVLPEKNKLEPVQDTFLQTKNEMFIEKMDIPQSVISFVHPFIKRKDPRFYAAFLLVNILGDSDFESRLFKRVREEGGLTYGIGLNIARQENCALLAGFTSTQNASVETVIGMIKEEWQKIVDKGVTESELAFAKDRLIGGYPLTFTTTKDTANALVAYQLDDLPPDYINKRNDFLKNVTLQEINEVAKTLLAADKLTFFIVGMPKFKEKKDEKRGEKKEEQKGAAT